jgi:hypothetical protein
MSQEPAPASPSAEYTATLDGVPTFVHSFAGFAGGSIAWIKFAFDSAHPRPIEVRVRVARLIDHAALHPLHAGLPVRVEGEDTVVFTLPRPGNFFLKLDGEFQLPLYIFALPHATSLPGSAPNYRGIGLPELGAWGNARKPALIAFGPGVHRPGVIRLHSGHTLYLAPGAEVYGTVIAEGASDLRICGGGILRGSHMPFQGDGTTWHMISLRRCRRVLIEDVTVLDGFCWNVVLHDCEDVTVRWIQVMAERLYSTDGINPCNSRRVTLEDCFVRSKDDCVAVKGFDWDHPDPRDWSAIHDITVRRCVLWSDNNNAVVVGCETRASVIERIVFEDCDILSSSNTCGDWAGALSVIALDDTVLRAITFRRIRVERALGPLFNFNFCAGVFGIPDRRLPGGGTLGPIVVEDVELLSGPSRRSFVRGLDATRRVGPVSFRRVRVRGQLVRDAAALRLVTNEHTHDIHFVPEGATPARESSPLPSAEPAPLVLA